MKFKEGDRVMRRGAGTLATVHDAPASLGAIAPGYVYAVFDHDGQARIHPETDFDHYEGPSAVEPVASGAAAGELGAPVATPAPVVAEQQAAAPTAAPVPDPAASWPSPQDTQQSETADTPSSDDSGDVEDNDGELV